MTVRPITVGIVAGETSGDILAAGLIRALKVHNPAIRFVGVAGPLMQKEGCEAWFEMEELSVMGIVEVLKRLPRILKIRRDLIKRFKQIKPDLFIGVDAPDFNLDVEKRLKQVGIKTVHYVSPSVWAWKQKRVFKIKKATDLILVFLPFEKAFYDRFDVNCQFIGHKMADDIPLSPDTMVARAELNIPPGVPCLAILPGSRHAEVELLSTAFLDVAQQLKHQLPELHFVVPLVNEKRRQQFLTIKQQVAPNLSLQLLDGQARCAMIASNAALLASGTATLECMLAKCPMVVAYRLKPLTYWLVKKLIKIPYVSLPNILADEQIVREFIQQDCTPDNLAAALYPLLTESQDALKVRFFQLHQIIRCDADQQAASAVLALIDG